MQTGKLTPGKVEGLNPNDTFVIKGFVGSWGERVSVKGKNRLNQEKNGQYRDGNRPASTFQSLH